VQRLDIELLYTLEFDKAHGRAGGGFGNRLAIQVVFCALTWGRTYSEDISRTS
jgi:hypothetical protein